VLPVVGLAMKTRFTEEMFGKEVKAEKEVLFQGVQEPSPEVRGYLKTDDDIFVIKTRRTVNGEPAYLDESMIPRGVLPDIETIDPTKTSLYSLLQERGTRKIFKVVQTIEIVKAGSGIAGHLDLEEGEQVLAVHRLLLSSDGSPVAYARLLGRADRYKFQAEFERIR
jgi:DNA-binding GntR family transcriptional regulator